MKFVESSRPISLGRGGLKRLLKMEQEPSKELIEKILDSNIGTSFPHPEREGEFIKVTGILKQQAIKYKNPLAR